MRLLQDLTKRGGSVSPASLYALIPLLSTSKDGLSWILDSFNKMPQKLMIGYHSLFESMLGLGEYDLQFTLFNEIKSRNDINGFICGLTIVGRSRCGDYKNIFSVIDILRKMNHNTPGLLQGYASAMSTLFAMRKVGTAMTMKRELEENKEIKLDSYYYNILARGLATCDQVEEAFEARDKIIKEGFTVAIKTYNSLIGACMRTNNIEKAEELFWELENNKGTPPERFTYFLMMDGYAKNGDMKEAMKVKKTMEEKAMLGTMCYNSLINRYVKMGDMENALILRKEMKMKDVLTHTHVKELERRLKEAKDEEKKEVRVKLDRAKNNIIKTDIITFTTLADGFATKGELEEVKKILKEMSSNGIQPSIGVCH